MRVLVCGSRTWRHAEVIEARLSTLADECVARGETLTVIEGGARGADFIAGRWAKYVSDVLWIQFPADWVTHGKAAGPIRNQRMLTDGKPDLVLAYTDKPLKGTGTADMVRRARKAGLPVEVHNGRTIYRLLVFDDSSCKVRIGSTGSPTTTEQGEQ